MSFPVLATVADVLQLLHSHQIMFPACLRQFHIQTLLLAVRMNKEALKGDYGTAAETAEFIYLKYHVNSSAQDGQLSPFDAVMCAAASEMRDAAQKMEMCNNSGVIGDRFPTNACGGIHALMLFTQGLVRYNETIVAHMISVLRRVWWSIDVDFAPTESRPVCPIPSPRTRLVTPDHITVPTNTPMLSAVDAATAQSEDWDEEDEDGDEG